MYKWIALVISLLMGLFLIVNLSPGFEDYSYSVGTGYMLVRTSSNEISVVPEDGNDGTKPEIKPKVVQIGWDEQYVIAKQFGLKRAYQDDPNKTYEVPDENKIQYFILDTIELKLYGGYNFSKFLEEKKALGISDG